MRRLGWSLLVVLSLVLAVPGGASAKTANACKRAAAAPGMKVLARSGAAVVFERVHGTQPYGCTYRKPRVRKLDTCCTDLKFKVAGVYAGYAATGSAIGDESTKLGVFDLRTGRLRAIRKLAGDEGAGREIDTNSLVSAFLVSTGGGLAWIQSNGHFDPSQPGPGVYGPDQELRAAAGAHPWERVVDEGRSDTGGGLAKLRLSDGLLSWTNQGVARTTALDVGPYRGKCGALKGTDVLSTDSLRIVKRPARYFDGTFYFVGERFFGCALPSGVVHYLGRAGSAYLYNVRTKKRGLKYVSETLEFTNPAGTYVLRTIGGERRKASSYYLGDVVDTVHGVDNTYASFGIRDGSRNSPEETVPLSTVLSPTGVFAGIFADGGHRVVALTPLGAKRVLDTGAEADIPAASLSVDGSTVRWTNAGAAKTAVVADGG